MITGPVSAASSAAAREPVGRGRPGLEPMHAHVMHTHTMHMHVPTHTLSPKTKTQGTAA